MADRVSIHAAESLADLSDDSVQDGDPSSRSAASPTSSSKNKGRKRRRVVSSSDSSSESSSDSSSSESDSETESDTDSSSRTKRSVCSETVSAVTTYERFNPTASSSAGKAILSKERLKYAKAQFSTFVKDEIVEKNILEHALIPDDPHFQCKQIDEFVYPIMDKLNADLDRGAEKGIQGVQKRIFRIMGPLSQLWEMSDSIREHSKENPTVDNVDIAHMCQLVEKTVCSVGQASLAVDRHRRVNTLLKITEDYKKAKELLDKNEDVISQSGNCLFGEGFKKVLKKSSKTWEEASKIAFSIKKGRKKKGGFKKKRRGGYHHMNYNYDHESSHASHGTKHRHANPRRERESPFRDGPLARGRGAGGRGMARGHGSAYRGRGYRR
ncbi:uncharacterized protein LOC127731963 [Mytilus californianus]|uniref:uncharacterized protein LOC127731963 n=1 Tax=Mytilus californianus TaxID=6549 RepID=UPI0022459E5D|nr:uncharacterized protein LOC127731963 [Mytilus californianus]